MNKIDKLGQFGNISENYIIKNNCTKSYKPFYY